MLQNEGMVRKALHAELTDRWTFGNDILYRMCAEHPRHNNDEEIVGKIWLIGRSYAASIERRPKATEGNDDFYFEKVAPVMRGIGNELDSNIEELKNDGKSIIADFSLIIETHELLQEAFEEITELKKRSLASKYLHFHVPSKFFIYDSRANRRIREIVHKPFDFSIDMQEKAKNEYRTFAYRMLELARLWRDELGHEPSPRELDTFLLMDDLKWKMLTSMSDGLCVGNADI